jgi:SAM-dependent methyltransferase
MIQYDTASFKDPAGRVFQHDGWIYRSLSQSALHDFTVARDRGLITSLCREGLLVDTELLTAADVGLPGPDLERPVLRQPQVSFVSYSYEWSFEMLRDAALATLRIIERALASGFILKDANAFNILFDGPRAKLVDVPSLEPYREGEVWAGYGQFCRSFLFPLLLSSYRDIDFRRLLRGGLGELSVHDTLGMLRARDFLRAGVLADVYAQARLERTFGRRGTTVKSATAPVRYPKTALVHNVKRLSALIERLRVPSAPTEWTDYETFHSYSEADRTAKEGFVRRSISGGTFTRVVDLGCNTGEFSRIALDAGSAVVSLDVDALAIDRLYRATPPEARLSPIVASLLNPTPAMGWGLQERRGLLDRLKSDSFLALALIHHLRITGGVPLEMIVAQLFAIAPEGVVEWVDKDDGMVRQMLSLRPDVYDDYTWTEFEALLRRHGQIVAVQPTHGGRRRLCHVRAVSPAHAHGSEM